MTEDSSASVKDRLLDAALAVVARQGVGNLTLEAVAAETKVSKGCLLHHFPAKDRLVEAILKDTPHNEVKRGAEASLVTSMGRMAAHTGQVITYDEMLNCEHEFGPTIDQLAMNSPAPVLADENGRYPIPMPGITTTREY